MKNMVAVRRRYWTLAVRHDGKFIPEFGSSVRGEAIAEMSKWRRKGFRRSDLKIIASDADWATIEKAVAALNSDDLQKQYDTFNATPAPSTPQQYAAYVLAEQAKWGPVVLKTGVKLE